MRVCAVMMAVMYLEDPGRIAGYIINRLVDSMKATRSALPLSWTRRAILRPRGMQESTSSTLACSLKNAWSFCNCMHFFDKCIWCFMHFMHFMHLMQMSSWHWCALYSRMICLYVECVLFFLAFLALGTLLTWCPYRLLTCRLKTTNAFGNDVSNGKEKPITW